MSVNELKDQKEREIYRIAHELFSQSPEWVVFFREVMGLEGVITKSFEKPEDIAQFETTREFAEIQQMLAKLRERLRSDRALLELVKGEP